MTDGAKKGLAIRIVQAIEKELRGRRGISQEWDQIDIEIQDEIRATLVELVEEQFPEEEEDD